VDEDMSVDVRSGCAPLVVNGAPVDFAPAEDGNLWVAAQYELWQMDVD